MILGDDYKEVLSKYFEELPDFLGGKCSCPKCANGVATVGERIIDLSDRHLNNTSSNSELYAVTSLSISREYIKIAGVGALLLWVCIVFILGAYYHQFMISQLYNRSGS